VSSPRRSSGEKGAARAQQVAAALSAGGMLQSIDSMLDGVQPVRRGAGSGRAQAAMQRAEGERRQALEQASRAESGGDAIASAAGAAGGHIDGGTLASATVDVGDLATVGGGSGAGGAGLPEARTPESLMAVVHRYAGGIKYCYDLRLRERPELRGRLVTLITVAPSGVVTRVKILGNTIKDEALVDCTLGQVQAWKFPGASGGAISFRCPFVFTPPNVGSFAD
jgi:outer membrane biosynthesis protein TonB